MLRRRSAAIKYDTFSVKGRRMCTNMLQSILDCSEANEGFYVKCGFKRAGLEMSHYYS